jgi:hypothetical protein
MAHLVHAEILFNPDWWASRIPASEVMTVEDALRAVDIVVSESKGAVKETGWKVHPELKDAQAQMQILADGLEAYVARGVHRLKLPYAQKLRAALIERGLRLYNETSRLVAAWEGKVDFEQARAWGMKRKIEDVLMFDVPVIVLVGLGAWLWWTTEKNTRGNDVLARFGI